MEEKIYGIDRNVIEKFNRQVITENNIMRKEKLLILPYNTLRVFDLFVQADLEKVKDPTWKGDFMATLRKVLTRKEKDLGKLNNIDSSLVKKLMEDSWIHYYKLAPRTNLYALVETLNNQKFMEDAIVLFHKRNIKEDDLTNAYYDGSIEGLEKFINENRITALAIDDVELLMTLINRGNVSFDWKTVFISKLGYNYYKEDKHNMLLMKYSDKWSEKYAIEVASLDLI